MPGNSYVRSAALLVALLFAVPVMAAVDVATLAKHDAYQDVKISPTGAYLAATVKLEDRTALVVIRRSDLVQTAAVQMGKDSHIDDFNWVSDERVLVSMAASLGQLDQPEPTGELVAINADGKRFMNLVGFRVPAGGASTLIKTRKPEEINATLVDDLPDDDRRVIIAVSPWLSDAYTTAERMDVMSGNRQVVARAPVRRAKFTTDSKGVVRFALGADIDNVSQLYYRASDTAEWRLINDESKSSRVETVLGFSPDEKLAYLRSEQADGPDAIVSWDVATGERKQVLRDDGVDPWLVLRELGVGKAPVGVMLMDGKPRSQFFDDKSREALLYRSLEAGFAGQAVLVTSSTTDGREVMVQVFSDTNPGDFYILNSQDFKAQHVLSRRPDLKETKLASMQPVTLTARDGLELHGYLTRPADAPAGPLPMVVLPHGGPIGVFDAWGYDAETQILAQAGYAVLQVNFRGSGNRGRAFQQAGARQWGGTMQDDLMDATRWAVEQGHADGDRLCIYGASYGAYAALVAAAREPELFQCAVGYVGVYDLDRMLRDDRRNRSDSLVTFNREWVGEVGTMASVSPVNMAASVKVPVFLAAGGQDSVAPIAQSKAMEAALDRAGVDVQTLYYTTEGHGFYTEANRIEYYTQLLAFLSTHLGGAKAK
ncbi:MAG: prolyl oligopeptidase family serine peptidase [Pseudoxanthomonas sp.]|nr:prolyl oligopeptidase family serine peptidase [Pseudoxanthomonas sp.]